jgi:membrane protease YdiL (CAAX protease family)
VRLAILLGVVAGIATLCVFPYVLAIMPQIGDALRARHVPIAMLVAGQSVQALVLCAIASWVGLRLGRRSGLDAPLLRAWVCRESLPSRAGLGLSALLGVAAAAVVLVMAIGLQPVVPAGLAPVARWKLLLAAFYGGIAEEVMARLFILTLVAWLLERLRGAREGGMPRWVAWSAIVVSSLLFAAGHLPTALAALGPTPLVIARTFALNTIPGMLFGWLYWRRGLEHAMLAHFCADLVLHGIGGS